MKLVEDTYSAMTGYHDISPGLTPFRLAVHKLEDGTIVARPTGIYVSHFNEIQIDGNPDLRKSYLPQSDNGSSILFTTDTDYDKKYLRRLLMSTKDIPLTESDNFVKRWGALAGQNANIIELGTNSERPNYFDKGSWGEIDDMTKKKAMLNQISNMDSTTRDALQAVDNSTQFSVDFIAWRETLAEGVRIKYQSAGV